MTQSPASAGVRGAFLFQLTILRRRAVLLGGAGLIVLLAVLIDFAIFANVDKDADVAAAARRGIPLAELTAASGSVNSLIRTDGPASLLGVIAMVIGASAVASVYSLGTLRVLLVRQPRRARLLAGLVLGVMVLVALVAVLTVLVTIGVSFGFAQLYDVSTSAWTSSDGLTDMARAVGQVALMFAGFAFFGSLLAVILRSNVASIASGVAYILIVENLVVGLVWDGGKNWLPGRLLAYIGEVPGTVVNPDGGTPSFGRALGVFAIYAVVASLGAGALFKRRDVSI